jgi:hypothetical protein
MKIPMRNRDRANTLNLKHGKRIFPGLLRSNSAINSLERAGRKIAGI